jgi:predicted ArsR family transcriptional regulator
MGRPKKEYETERVEFTVEVSEKEKWTKFAESLGKPLAQVIKEAMSKAMYKTVSTDPLAKIEKLIEKQQEELSQLSKKYFDVIEELSNRKEVTAESMKDTEDVKTRINALLKKMPMAREDIASILNIEKKDLRIIIGEMKIDGDVKYDPESRLWSV